MTPVAYGIAFPASRGVLAPPARPLLERISATPTAAFATWRLRSAYAGADERVRRSSDNSEQDIGFGGAAQDTGSLSSFAGAGSAFATKLYDQGASARSLAQAPAACQPRSVNAGVLETVNGNPALTFDGVDDLLSGLTCDNYISAGAYTYLLLFQAFAGLTSTGSTRLQPSVFGAAAGVAWTTLGTDRITVGHYDGAEKITEFTGLAYPSAHVIASRYDGTTIKAWRNGGAGQSVAAGNVANIAAALQFGKTGNGAYGNFKLLAALMFNSAISLTDINTAGAALAAKGGLAWSTAT